MDTVFYTVSLVFFSEISYYLTEKEIYTRSRAWISSFRLVESIANQNILKMTQLLRK
jgi:hypothetical protein